MAVVRSGVPRSPRTAARFVPGQSPARDARVRFRISVYVVSDMEYVATSKTSDPKILSS